MDVECGARQKNKDRRKGVTGVEVCSSPLSAGRIISCPVMRQGTRIVESIDVLHAGGHFGGASGASRSMGEILPSEDASALAQSSLKQDLHHSA